MMSPLRDNPFAGGRYQLAFDLMTYKQGVKVLDVGCGNGGFLGSLLKCTNQLCGIDLDRKSLANLRCLYPDILAVLGIGEQLPFKSEFFDIVFALDIIEHTSDDGTVIAEISRVLKKGGSLILSTPYKGPFAFLDPQNVKFYFPLLHRSIYKLTGKMDVFQAKFCNAYLYGNFSKCFCEDIRHKHYSLGIIRSILGGRFHIEEIHRRGCFLTPLCLIANSFYSLFFNRNSKLLFRLWFWDYSVEYGILANSLMIKAKKI